MFLEVVSKELLRGRLFSVPRCHSPEPEEDGLFLERHVV